VIENVVKSEAGTEKLGSNEEAVKPEDVKENRNRNCRRLKQELWKLKRGAHHREKAKKQEPRSWEAMKKL
jgi:hypothetical protein